MQGTQDATSQDAISHDARQQIRPDIGVIGAGAGGLAAASAAAAFGVNVVLVERAKMGGENLNSGALPSKALIAAAGVARLTMAEQEVVFDIPTLLDATLELCEAAGHA